MLILPFATPFLIFLLLTTFQATADQGLPSQEEWWNAVCRGEKLDGAMRWSEPQANHFLEPLHSPWDGDLMKEFAKWGYTESFRSAYCDFDATWSLQIAFWSLGIDPRSTARGGPNQCFIVQHGSYVKGLPMYLQNYTVGDMTYRVTTAASAIGVNPVAGMIFFINVISPGKAAEAYWGRKPESSELPALRAQSDFAWGFWNRMIPRAYLGQINALWSTKVINEQTRDILNLAFRTYQPAPGQQKVDSVQLWPGTDFDISTIEGQAILGSPNGIAPGYFLAQHKRQFGSNKMIYKITVFKDSIMGELPTLIFWVSDVLNINGGQASNANVHARELSKSVSMLSDTVLRPVGRFQEPRMVSTSLDRRDVLREHVALVEL